MGPKPPSFGAQRRLVAHKDEPLLFEAELVKVKEAEELPQVGRPAGLPVICCCLLLQSLGPCLSLRSSQVLTRLR